MAHPDRSPFQGSRLTVPGILTEITEIVTGLGTTGLASVEEALSARPAQLLNVGADHWTRLENAYASGMHHATFEAAWANGRAFLESPDALRGRVPLTVEWKGPLHQPGYDTLPADLRLDHVYLVSCKYKSRIIANSSPANLFVRRLADRAVGSEPESWFSVAARDEFRHFYECVRRYVGLHLLPARHQDLNAAHVLQIRAACGGSWPTRLAPLWREFSLAVSEASARSWNATLDTATRREEMLWRLLRLGAAPYFVLGLSNAGPMRLRIGTPWDWRQRYALADLQIEATPSGQPRVAWRGVVNDRDSGQERAVAGHVEIRWAHGRFSTVEAKIYLDTPHAETPGYFPLMP